jgi:hypothetical protein
MQLKPHLKKGFQAPGMPSAAPGMTVVWQSAVKGVPRIAQYFVTAFTGRQNTGTFCR